MPSPLSVLPLAARAATTRGRRAFASASATSRRSQGVCARGAGAHEDPKVHALAELVGPERPEHPTVSSSRLLGILLPAAEDPQVNVHRARKVAWA